MFIEITSYSQKYLINTRAIKYIKPYIDKKTAPTINMSIIIMEDSESIIVSDESYDKLRERLIEHLIV